MIGSYLTAASLCLSGVLLVASATAQTLVLDINATSPGAHSEPREFTSSGGLVYFIADDGVHGDEIWWTNGTYANIAADIRPGSASSNPTGMYPFLGGLIVIANDGTHGQELHWVTNAGAVLLEINPGSQGTGFGFGVAHDTTFYISASTPSTGMELWATDAVSVRLVRDIVIGPGNGVASYAGLAVVNDRIVFNGTEPLHGMELWSTDGTAAGTALLQDVAPGTTSGLGNGQALVSDGTYVFFMGFHPASGNELWMSDGTTNGTVLVEDLVPGTGSSAPQPLLFFNQRLYMRARTPATGTELFSVQRNTGPISLLKDITPGSGSSTIPNLAQAGDLLFFTSGTIANGTTQLQRTDGTLAGTFPVAGMGVSPIRVPGHMNAIGRGTRVVFQGVELTLTGSEPWLSDGTVAGTVRLLDVEPGVSGSTPAWFTVTDNYVVFAAQQAATGLELFSMPLSLTRGCIVETLMPGCPGPGGYNPLLYAFGIPRFNSTGFSLNLMNVPANMVAGFALSLTGVPGVGGCALQVGQPIASTTFVMTSPAGFASMPLPVPSSPAFLSFQLFAQAFVLQPGGGFMGAASLSNGLRIVVGDY